ncbi:MAG: hypothetical protein KIT10_08510 [Flavobacteriales bacterium]|nr:hypothetical protein [Flavobacteriales bacterium]
MERWILFALLLFNGLTAVVAGAMLSYAPDGSLLELPLAWLDHSPFRSYRIPGLLLFSVIGLGSLVAAALVWRRHGRTGRFAQVAGSALVIWIVTQMIMLRSVLPIQLLYLGIGMAIIVLGERTRKN